jgi:hypothetical protein
MLAQAIHTFLAGKADGTDSQAEICGNFGVWARGSFEEKEFDKAAALRGEGSHGFA